MLVAITGCEDAKNSPIPAAEFDIQAWIAAKGDHDPIRQSMIKSLENKLKVGMSIEDIVYLIGEPDLKIDSDSGKAYIYYLGRGLIDYEEFQVIFDNDSKVVKFMQVQG